MTETTEQTLEARGKTHGEYTEHARCTQAIMSAVMRERNYQNLSDIQKESLHMFAHKMGRIVVGNPDEPDHWKDIAGYAVLVEQRLTDPQKYESLQEANRHKRVGYETIFLDYLAGTVGVTVDDVKLWWEKNVDRVRSEIAPVQSKPSVTREISPHFPEIKIDGVVYRNPEAAAQRRVPRFPVPEQSHESTLFYVPWVIDAREASSICKRLASGGHNTADATLIFETFWSRRSVGVFVLEPYVVSSVKPVELQGLYGLSDEPNLNTWILRVDRCPPEVRDYFPSVQHECNATELKGLPEWQRGFYEWISGEDKFRVKEVHRAWVRQS